MDIKYLGKFINRNVNVVYKKFHLLNNHIYPNNYNINTKYIEIGKNTTKKLLDIKKEITLLGCDQKPFTNTKNKKILFLNNYVDFHYGPANISLKTNKKIWYIYFKYCLKNKKNYWYFTNISDQLSINSSSYEITQKIAEVLTNDIITNPEQYFWVHNRFNYRV